MGRPSSADGRATRLIACLKSRQIKLFQHFSALHQDSLPSTRQDFPRGRAIRREVSDWRELLMTHIETGERAPSINDPRRRGAGTCNRIDDKGRSSRTRHSVIDHDHAADSDVENSPLSKGRLGLTSKTAEICRLDPLAQVIGTFQTLDARLELLRFSKRNFAQLEFLLPCHLVILLSEGISAGCEWTDGEQTRKISSLAPNTVMFNPAQNYLRIRTNISKDNCCMLILAMKPSLMSWRRDLEVDLQAVQLKRQIGFNDEWARQALVAMRREIEAPGINSVLYVETLLFLLLIRLIRCASNPSVPTPEVYAKGGLPNWRLKRAIKILEGDPAVTPSLSDVARSIGLHPASFCRGFKQSTGSTPHHYLLVHRVNRAKEMMSNPQLSLTEIALDCGFGSSSQFSVVFRRITGMSPRDFRRSL
jgi:AraC-like DNA-binding protein